MPQAYGLYTHIRANRTRSMLLLGGLFLLVYVMVFAGALAGRALTTDASLQWYMRGAWHDLGRAWPYATIGTLLWVFIAYKFHQSMIDAVTGARDVSRKEEPRLYNLLENLCISRGIPMPKLKIMDAPELNAFATGLTQPQYAITVTSGLLERLDDAETEAVLGHELTHIRNGDVRLMVIAVVIAGAIGFFAELIFRTMFNAGGSIRPGSWSRRSRDDGDNRSSGGAVLAIVIALALIAFAWFLSALIRFALSRSREYLADAGSVELTKNPDAMISALRKIEGRGELPTAPSAVMEMCVDNPRHGFADLFDTHPSVEARIAVLVRVAGGRDPGPLALPDFDDPQGGEPYADMDEGGASTSVPPVSETQPSAAPAPKPFLPPVSPLAPGARPGPWGAGPWGPRPPGGGSGSGSGSGSG
jgi:heat shock protein HtpX